MTPCKDSISISFLLPLEMKIFLQFDMSTFYRSEGLHRLTWMDVIPALEAQQLCPNVLSVIKLLLTLPVHSAECERGFSVMKKVKSDWRATLDEDALNDLLRICLLSKPIGSFDPIPAIKLWHVSGKQSKRPDTEPYGQRQNNASSDSDSD